MAEGTSVGTISLNIDITQDLERQIDNGAKNISSGLQSGIEKGLNIDSILKSFSANLENSLKASLNVMQKATESSIDNIKSKAMNSINEISNAVKNIPQYKPISGNGSSLSTIFNRSNKTSNNPKAQTGNAIGADFNPITSQMDILSRQMDIFSNKAMNARQKVNELNAQIAELGKDTGNPTLNQINTYQIERLRKELAEAQTEEEKFGLKSDSMNLKLQTLTDKMNGGAAATNKNAKAVRDKASSFGEASSKGTIFGTILNRLRGQTDTASAATRQHSSIMDRLGLSFTQVGRMMDRMLLRMVIFNTVINGLSTFASFIGKALMTNSQFSASLQQIQSNLMTAFMPIYNAVLPALNTLMQGLASATSYIASFISQLFGTTYKASYNNASALQNQIGSLDMAEKQAKKTADSLGTVGGSAKKTSDAIKEAAAASKKGLAGFDEINKLGSTAASTKSPKIGTPAGSGVIAPITPTANMGPIESATAGWADKFRNILAGLWQPFKDAWAAEGMNTISAAKHALSGIEDLIGSIAKSFYTVWTNGTGTKILTNMLKILQDIFNIVGDIGHTWANAWNSGNIGTQIVQDLANAFNNVLSLIDKVLKSVRKVFAEEGPTFAGIFMQALKNTSGIIENVTQKLGWIWDHGGQHAFEGLVRLGMKVGELAMTIYNQFVAPFVEWFINNISPAIAKVLDWIGKLFDKMSDLITWLNGSGKPVLDVIMSAIAGVAAGIGTWKVINTAIDWWNKIKNIPAILDSLKSAIAGVNAIMMANPIALVASLIAGLVVTLVVLYNKNKWFHDEVNKIFSDLKKFFKKAADDVKGFFQSVGQKFDDIGKWFGDVGSDIKNTFEKVKNKIYDVGENIKDTWDRVVNWFENLPGRLWNAGSNMFTSLKNGISSVLDTIGSTIENGFESAISYITSLPDKAWQWGKDFINGLGNGIQSGFNWVKDKVSNLADTIASYLHFSKPDIGSLREYETWMPDFMKGLANGVESSKGTLINALQGLTSNMSISAQVGLQQPKLAFAPSGDIQANQANNNGNSGPIDSGSINLDEIIELLKDIFDYLKNNVGGNGDVKLKVDGDTFAKIAIREINRAQYRAGRTLLQV